MYIGSRRSQFDFYVARVKCVFIQIGIHKYFVKVNTTKIKKKHILLKQIIPSFVEHKTNF